MRKFARALAQRERASKLARGLARGYCGGVVEDMYTTGEAARVLRVSESRVRQLLSGGELEGSRDVNGRWQIPQRAVHERMDRRGPREPRPQQGTPVDVDALIERLAQAEHARGRAEQRLELTERTESTLREDLERERERADRAERERERADRAERELSELRGLGFWARLFGGG
jgi:excisionase family DNA binding protein